MTSSGPHEPNRSFYNRISRTYDLIADAGEHRAREAGEKLLAVQPGERVLEIGFGTGNSLLALAQLVGKDGHVSGIDISEGMREVAQDKLDEAGVAAQVELQVGDARTLPYVDGSFNAAFMSFTLELFERDDIPLVLAEIKRVLRDDGRYGVVSMSTVAVNEKESMLERTYVWMHRHFPHIVDCQPIDVEGLVHKAGFRVTESTRMDIWTLPVVAVVAIKQA